MSEEKHYFFSSLSKLYEVMKDIKRGVELEERIGKWLKNTYSLDLQEKVKCTLEIPDIGLIPVNKDYFRLYWELRQLYISRLFYSTIVLGGVLCERMCYDILSTQEIKIGNRILSHEQISSLFEMNLRYLIELLFKWGLIKGQTRKEMLKINDYEKRIRACKKRQIHH